MVSMIPALDFRLEQARRRLESAGGRVLEMTEGTDLETAGPGPFDAAWIAPVRLDGLDVRTLGRRVASVLRERAPVACVVPGCWPLRQLLERALLGVGDLPLPRRARLEGRPVNCMSAASWREALGSDFSWRRVRGVGIFVAANPTQAERHALALGALAAADYVTGGWPVFRGLGGRILLEGERW
jgi:hypothetical protein